jgi:WD40 repeat protein
VALRNGGAEIIDAQSGTSILSLKGHDGWVHGVSWSPDGKHLATSGDDEVKMWDVARINPRVIQINGKRGTRWGDAQWTSDGKYLGTYFDGAVQIIDTATFQAEHKVPSSEQWSWNPRESASVGTFVDNSIRTVRITDNVDLVPPRRSRVMQAISYSPDGKYLAVAVENPRFQVWDTVQHSLVFEASLDTDRPIEIAWSKDGRRLACSGGWTGTAIVYDTTNWKTIARLSGHQRWLADLNWNPEGTRLAGAGWDQSVWIWDVESSQVVHKLVGHSGMVTSVSWSRAGDRLASVSPIDQSVRLWNTSTGDELMVLPAASASSVAFSPDGNRLAVSSTDGIVQVWSAARSP